MNAVSSKKTRTLLERLSDEFLEYLMIEKDRAEKTRENYKHYIARFLRHTGIARPEEITAERVRRYRVWLHEERVAHGGRMKTHTQMYHLIALRNFLKYLAKRDIKTLSPEKIELAKMPARTIQFMEQNELDRLLDAPRGDDIRSIRDKAILETLFSTGMRVSELASLNRDSIDFSRGECSVFGKGRKYRVVFISDRAKDALRAYLKKRSDVDEALFIRIPKSGSFHADERIRMTTRSIERMVQKYSAAAGIAKKVTPHVLRHQFATDLLRNGADIRSVQAMLGHAHITTTQIYTHVTDAALREVHKKFHGKQE